MIERQEPLARVQDGIGAGDGGTGRHDTAGRSADDSPAYVPAMAGKLRAARGIALAMSASAIVWLLIYAAVER